MLAEIENPATIVSRAAAVARRSLATAEFNATACHRATHKRAALVAAAAQAAPAAIAAATTDRERDLITRIFDAVPGVIAASQAHSEADEADDDTVDAKHEVWDQARRAIETLAVHVADLAPESPADALRRVKLYRQVLAFTECAPIGEGNDGIFAEDALVMGEAAIRALERLAGSGPGDDAARALWRAAVATYEAAKVDYDANAAASEALTQRIDASAPDWLRRPRRKDGKPIVVCDTIRRFDVLTSGNQYHAPELPELIDRREEFLGWLDSIAGLMANRDAVDDQDDPLYAALCNAERALIETPAPDMAALAYKQVLLARELDDEKRGFDDPIYYAVARDIGLVALAWPAHIYADVRRLAGQPVPDFEPFRPRLWSNRFKEAGGQITLNEDGDGFTITLPGPDAHQLAAAAAIAAELDHGRAREVMLRYLQEIS